MENLKFKFKLENTREEYINRIQKYKVIIEDIINIIDNIKKLFLIRKFRTIHLGKNPKNGGNPPIDIKFIIKVIFKFIFKFKLEI